MTIDREFLELVRSEVKDGLVEFRSEVKSGFTLMGQQMAEFMSQSNVRLDMTNARIDTTNAKLDQTNIRLDASINMVREFRKDVSSRLDEVGVYLRAINGSVVQHEERIKSLEQRMNKFEQTG